MSKSIEIKVDLENMVGTEADFYGVNGNTFKLDARAFEVIENEQDGYRSTLDYVRMVPLEGGFFDQPLARVRMRVQDGGDGLWQLVDVVDDHVWLEFGTANADDYYPCFIFRYQPKGGREQ